MPIYTSGAARVSVDATDATVALDSRRTRPLWFDGRFMAARDLEREQNYFLQREADLGQAPGFESIRGLMVDQRMANGRYVGSGSIVIHAGDGVTPAGELVMVPQDVTVPLAELPLQDDLGIQLTPTAAPAQSPQARSGLYIVALQPVEYSANLVTAYPTTVQGPLSRHDSDIVQATAVSLVPYPNPPSNYPPAMQQAALARQIFLLGNAGKFPDSLLPLAVISLEQGVVQWVDPYLVRRDTGGQTISVGFGLSDEITQQAFLLQYDTQLQAAAGKRQASGLKANFAATDVFYALPGVGRIPIDAIDTGSFSQVFFPQEMDVRISIIPSDELPALLEEGLAMPPIDLTLPTSAYADMTVFVLVPVPRGNFAALKSSLPLVTPSPILPQVLANRSPLQLLQLFKGDLLFTPAPAISNSSWASAIGGQNYVYYVRWRDATTPVVYKTPAALVTLNSSLNPSPEGTAVTFSAQVLPANATGNVEFDDATASIGSAPLVSGGSATLTVSNLVVGTHNITAVYGSGDANHVPGRSAPLAQVVVKALSTTALSSSPSTSTFGQQVTLTATVAPTSATGTVTFSGVSAAPAAVKAGGVATQMVSLPVGKYTVTASYGGDSQTGGSASAPITLTVNKANAAVSLTSPATAVNVGQSVTFNASVTPVTASGNVQFLSGAQVLKTSALSGGAATGTATFATAGTFNITAKYVGDQNFNAATSNPLAVTVNKIATSVVVTSSVNPSDPQQSVTFTATITPAGATGNVQFASDGTSFGNPVPVSSAGVAASAPNSNLAPGQHNITASYSGDNTNAGSTSAPLAQKVKAASSVKLASSINPSDPGQPVTFTATVTPSTLMGTVQFFESATLLGSAPLTGGVAALPLTTLPSGSHSITATAPSDANTAASTSDPVVQVVRTASSVKLSPSPNPSDPGNVVTYTATVTPTTAGGTVDFLEGTTTRASGAVKAGVATGSDSTLPAGAHTITARYNGDNNNTTSTSAPITQTVRAATTVKMSSSPNPSPEKQLVILTATVTPTGATGSVDFVDAKAGKLGSSNLTSISGLTAPVTVANLSATGLAAGVHSITAAYNGDGKNTPGTSDPFTQTVQATTTTTVTASEPKIVAGKQVTLTAKVTPATATGKVQFNDTVNQVTTTLATVDLASGGSASFVATLTAVGTHSITAAYQGDTTDAKSTSAAVTVAVAAPPPA